MAKREDIPKTDPSEIEALIKPLNQSNIEVFFNHGRNRAGLSLFAATGKNNADIFICKHISMITAAFPRGNQVCSFRS